MVLPQIPLNFCTMQLLSEVELYLVYNLLDYNTA